MPVVARWKGFNRFAIHRKGRQIIPVAFSASSKYGSFPGAACCDTAGCFGRDIGKRGEVMATKRTRGQGDRENAKRGGSVVKRIVRKLTGVCGAEEKSAARWPFPDYQSLRIAIMPKC